MKPNLTAVTLLLAVCLSLLSYNSFSQCTPPPVVPLYTPVTTTINLNQSVTYTVSNAVGGYFYEVLDSASGQPLGQGILAQANGTLSLTTDIFTTIGTFTIFIKATYLLGITPCMAVSAYGTVTVNGVLLPLQLVQFKGKKQGAGILLEWETANEDRLNRFEIERSEAGSMFENTGQVAATAQAGSGKHYAFTDIHPLSPANYYRLKMIDQDGKFSYSNTILIRITGSLMINVLPNPFAETIILQVTLEKPQALHIRLIDAAGAVIYTKESSGRKGNNTIMLTDLSSLAAGNYFIQVRTTEDAIQQKIIKMNR